MLSESPVKLRVVFDTNVYIAAVLKGGHCAAKIKLAQAGKIDLYACREIFEELDRKLRQKFKIPSNRRREFFGYLNQFVKTAAVSEIE